MTVTSDPSRKRAKVRFAFVVVAASLVSIALPSSAFATTVTGVQTVPGSIEFNGVACASAAKCVAIGVGGNGTEVVVTITNDVPGPVQVVPDTSGLTGVACPNPTTCIVVGNRIVPHPGQRNGSEGLIVPVIDGVVGIGQPVPAILDINAVACASTTTCYALGVVTGAVAEVLTITDGIPGTVQAVPGGIGLGAVACPGTTCYAVGSTADGGVVVPITNGIPGATQPVLTTALLFTVACSSPTTCYATGLNADPFNPQIVLVPIINGVPGNPQTGSFGAIACATTSTCVSVGLDPNTGAVVVVPIIDGVPGAALTVQGSGNAFFSVACSSATTCVAVGGDNPNQIGVVATITLSPPCRTTITGNRTGTLVLRPGLTCLSGAHLNGSVVVGRGASLDIENSTVTGSISAFSPSGVQLCGNTIGGAVVVQGAKGFVLIGDPGDDSCAINHIRGSLNLRNNTHGVDAIGNRVRGAVTASGNSGAGPFPEDTAPDISANRP